MKNIIAAIILLALSVTAIAATHTSVLQNKGTGYWVSSADTLNNTDTVTYYLPYSQPASFINLQANTVSISGTAKTYLCEYPTIVQFNGNASSQTYSATTLATDTLKTGQLALLRTFTGNPYTALKIQIISVGTQKTAFTLYINIE